MAPVSMWLLNSSERIGDSFSEELCGALEQRFSSEFTARGTRAIFESRSFRMAQCAFLQPCKNIQRKQRFGPRGPPDICLTASVQLCLELRGRGGEEEQGAWRVSQRQIKWTRSQGGSCVVNWCKNTLICLSLQRQILPVTMTTEFPPITRMTSCSTAAQCSATIKLRRPRASYF